MAEATACIFAKPPVAGKTKTRLAASVGPANAAELAQAFLRDTLDTWRQFDWFDLVIAATEPFERDYLQGERMWIQPEGPLDVRIEAILRRALSESPRALAVGADSPGLPAHCIELARQMLHVNDAVIGPATDGGFYLIGLNRCPEGLLRGIEWSRPTTLDLTITRLHQHGFSVAVLQNWFDVDTKDDLARLEGLLAHDLIECPHTRAALNNLRELRRAADLI